MFFNYRSYCNFICCLAIIGTLFGSGCKQSGNNESKTANSTQKTTQSRVYERDVERNLQKETELRKKAESGDLEAQFLLGKYYCDLDDNDGYPHKYNDEELKFFRTEFFKWMRSSGEHGYLDAQLYLSDYYCRIDGTAQFYRNYIESARWLDMAIKQNSPEAMYKLAKEYGRMGGIMSSSHNFLICYNISKMADWYRKAAELGHAEAQFELGKFYHFLHRENLSEKYKYTTWDERCSEVKKWYKLAISNGNKEAEKYLKTWMELEALHDELAKDKSYIEKFRKHVIDPRSCDFKSPSGLEIGDFDSEFMLRAKNEVSYPYDFNSIFSGDCTKFIEELKKAAYGGHLEERYEAMTADSPEFVEIAKKGGCDAQFLLGDIYSGVYIADQMIDSMSWEERLAQAIKWYSMASRSTFFEKYSKKRISELKLETKLLNLMNKDSDSLNSNEEYVLGVCYLPGGSDLVQYDLEKALTWLKKAARDGSIEAQCRLGDIYLSDRYTVGSLDSRVAEAEKMYQMAVNNKQKDAHKRELAKKRLLCAQRIKVLLSKKKANTLNGDEYYELSEFAKRFRGISSKEEFIELRNKAAELGNTEAIDELIKLGNKASVDCLYEGYKKAEEFYRIAAKSGHKLAKEKLKKTEECIKGYENRKDYIDAVLGEKDRINICEQALNGDTGAMLKFWCAFTKQVNINELKEKCKILGLSDRPRLGEYRKLEKELLDKAKRGDVRAKYKLGCLYYMWGKYYDNTPMLNYGNRDFNKLYNVRYIYSESNEDVDYNKFYDIPYFEYSKDGEYYCMAFKWWREAASEGDSDSQYCVGMGSRDCLSGSMIEDIWFYRAAVQGDAFALHEFCESMLDEKSKSHKTFKNMDETKILELCKQFAENGDAGAQDMLSRMYLYGFGTEANLDEAKKWSLKAMEHEGYYPYSAYLYGLHKLGLDKY